MLFVDTMVYEAYEAGEGQQMRNTESKRITDKTHMDDCGTFIYLTIDGATGLAN